MQVNFKLDDATALKLARLARQKGFDTMDEFWTNVGKALSLKLDEPPKPPAQVKTRIPLDAPVDVEHIKTEPPKVKAVETVLKFPATKTKTCPVCGKEFVPTRKDQSYCSRMCKDLAYSRMYHGNAPDEPVVRFCKQCGKPIPERSARRTYCSAECHRLAVNRSVKIEPTKSASKIEPKSLYFEYLDSWYPELTTTQVAKDYNMEPEQLNSILKGWGIQVRFGISWRLTKEYEGQGYTVYKDLSKDGELIRNVMMWTTKGAKFIYGQMKQRGILPVMERGRS